MDHLSVVPRLWCAWCVESARGVHGARCASVCVGVIWPRAWRVCVSVTVFVLCVPCAVGCVSCKACGVLCGLCIVCWVVPSVLEAMRVACHARCVSCRFACLVMLHVIACHR